jgi:transcriptional regulator with PAS, ATPase and Fis domain
MERDLLLVGTSPASRSLLADIESAARTHAKVLILGETGAGKELVATLIHSRSTRRTQPFVAVNCSGIPETLLESELFGHVRGSFTGAYRDKPGLASKADNGVLFLDEIGELTPSTQRRLLQFIETGEIPPTGPRDPGGIEPRLNVRLITAASRSLADSIATGAFRDDLYYRLNVIRLTIPPLRDRGDDVVMLLRYHLQERARAHGVDAPRFSPRAEAILGAYRWPGNVRELTNLVERLVVRDGGAAGGEIAPEDLPLEITAC